MKAAYRRRGVAALVERGSQLLEDLLCACVSCVLLCSHFPGKILVKYFQVGFALLGCVIVDFVRGFMEVNPHTFVYQGFCESTLTTPCALQAFPG